MAAVREITCPGCGLQMPASDSAVYDGYYNTSPECWSVYTEVLGAEFGNALLFGHAHQLTVDTYAVQHAGGSHPDKSIDIHLCGLHLVLDRGLRPTQVPPMLQRLAAAVEAWPHYSPPADRSSLTACDVALADSVNGHIDTVHAWATGVWNAWSPHHPVVADLVTKHLGGTVPESPN